MVLFRYSIMEYTYEIFEINIETELALHSKMSHEVRCSKCTAVTLAVIFIILVLTIAFFSIAAAFGYFGFSEKGSQLINQMTDFSQNMSSPTNSSQIQ